MDPVLKQSFNKHCSNKLFINAVQEGKVHETEIRLGSFKPKRDEGFAFNPYVSVDTFRKVNDYCKTTGGLTGDNGITTLRISVNHNNLTGIRRVESLIDKKPSLFNDLGKINVNFDESKTPRTLKNIE